MLRLRWLICLMIVPATASCKVTGNRDESDLQGARKFEQAHSDKFGEALDRLIDSLPGSYSNQEFLDNPTAACRAVVTRNMGKLTLEIFDASNRIPGNRHGHFEISLESVKRSYIPNLGSFRHSTIERDPTGRYAADLHLRIEHYDRDDGRTGFGFQIIRTISYGNFVVPHQNKTSCWQAVRVLDEME